jgi:hypothetical protein
MPLVYVSLVSKRKISVSDMDKPKAKKLVVSSDEFEKIGAWLAANPGWSFMCSSSTNHPKEYGFRDDFDVNEVMSAAVNYAYGKLAIHIEPGSVTKAHEVIETAVKSYKHAGPVPFLFVRSGKDRQDVLITFKRTPDDEGGESELDVFLIGLKYAANLYEIEQDQIAQVRRLVAMEDELGQFPPGGASGGVAAKHRRLAKARKKG